MKMTIQHALCGLFTATALTMTAGMALANDRDLRAQTVPASSCHPMDRVSLDRLQITNGAWEFKGTATGTVDLWCPLPLNRNTVSDNSDDNDMTSYRVWYRDSDGTLPAARVLVQLTYRQPNGVMNTVGSQFNSNGFTTPFDAAIVHGVNHQLQVNAMYAFRVRLTRTSTIQQPRFSGISFTLPPIIVQ